MISILRTLLMISNLLMMVMISIPPTLLGIHPLTRARVYNVRAPSMPACSSAWCRPIRLMRKLTLRPSTPLELVEPYYGASPLHRRVKIKLLSIRGKAQLSYEGAIASI